MAEFCLNCWNELNHIHLTEKDVIMSEELDLCEGCGEIKTTIVKYRNHMHNRPIRSAY